MAGPPMAPKVLALDDGAPVAVTIDSAEWPYEALLVRGPVQIDDVDGVAPEYREAARRYFGDEQGEAWSAQFPDDVTMRRFRVAPSWVGVSTSPSCGASRARSPADALDGYRSSDVA